jgi:hypothetical protein
LDPLHVGIQLSNGPRGRLRIDADSPRGDALLIDETIAIPNVNGGPQRSQAARIHQISVRWTHISRSGSFGV